MVHTADDLGGWTVQLMWNLQRIGLEHLTTDERYASPHNRVVNRQTLIQTMSDRSALPAQWTLCHVLFDESVH